MDPLIYDFAGLFGICIGVAALIVGLAEENRSTCLFAMLGVICSAGLFAL